MARKAVRTAAHSASKTKKTVKATAAHYETKREGVHRSGNGNGAGHRNGNGAFAFTVPSIESMTEDFKSRWSEGAERLRAAFGQVGGFDTARASAEEVAEIWRDSFERAGKTARELNLQAISYAQGDINRFFDAARALLGAKSVKEWSEIQTQFVREQVETQMRQSKELGELSLEAAREAFAPITENVASAMQKLRTR
jgi:hypothetical protein